jgi:TPR repeat protein
MLWYVTKFRKFAIDQNNASQEFHYGYLLSEGRSVTIDLIIIDKYLKRAADQGRVA